jgi:anti-sigma factor RsiW
MTQDLHTLQPYIDGELTDAERAEVEAQLAADPELRAMADEQLQIRQVLRDLPRQTAPQALRARVLLALDDIDRESAPAPAPVPAARFARLRAFFRGTAVMLPAGAAALALFFVARSVEPPAAPAAAEAPQNLAVKLVDVPGDSGSPIRPVSLNTGAADEVVYQVGRQQIVDRRARAGASELPGREQVYRGARYHLAADPDGRPLVIFEVDGVRHTLRSAAPAERNLQTLLELGHLVRTAAAH